MPLPNFLCAGVQKAGTTTLHNILKQHADIYLPKKVKETKFFVLEEKFRRGKDYYENEFFSSWNGERAIGEIDPAIFFEEEAPARISGTLGKEVKLIFIFRNPVARAYSHYLMSKRKGFEKLSFEGALKAEPQRLQTDHERKFSFSYLSRGYYADQLNRFLKYFSVENMLFILFEEEFINNRQITFDHIQDFLNVEHAELNLEIRSNKAMEAKSELLQGISKRKNAFRKMVGSILPGAMKENMKQLVEQANIRPVQITRLDKERERELVRRYFLEDIHRLEELIKRDLGTWYQ